MKRTVRRTDTTGVANPFTGLVFCADCGAKMYNHRGRHTRSDGREYGSDTYNCSTYCLTIERETKQCFSHSVSTKALNELVLETIRTTASYAISNREEFIQKVRSISQVRQQEVAKELKRKVAKAQKRIAELDVLIKSAQQNRKAIKAAASVRKAKWISALRSYRTSKRLYRWSQAKVRSTTQRCFPR